MPDPAPRYPTPTWEDGQIPTPDQLSAWLRAHTPAHDARVAADMILGMYASERRLRVAIMRQRDQLRAACSVLEGQVARLTYAWWSARRRAVAERVDRLHLEAAYDRLHDHARDAGVSTDMPMRPDTAGTRRGFNGPG